MRSRFRQALVARLIGAWLLSGLLAATLLVATARGQTFDLNGANTVLPASPSFPNPFLSGSVNVANSGGAATLSEGGGTASTAIYSGTIADGAGTVGLNHTSGVTVLSGANTYSGATDVLGGALTAGSASGFSANSLFTVASGATLDVNGFNVNAANLAGAGTLTNNGAQGAWLYTNYGNVSTTFSGNIVDGASPVGIVSTGPGTLTLSGVNTNSLTTIISAGTVQAGSSTGLSPNAKIDFNNQGVLDINGFNSTVNGLSGYGGTVTNNGASAATLSVDSSTSPTFYGAVNDGASPLALTIIGNGVQTLSGTNTYSGVTTIAAGATLQFGDGYSVGTFGSGAIVDNGVLAFQEASGAGTQLTPLASNISGAGPVLQQGPGTVTLTGANSFTGGAAVNPNTNSNPSWYQYQLLFGSAASLPTAAFPSGGALTLNNGGVAGTTYALDQNFLNTVVTTSYGGVALGADSDNNLTFDTPALANISLGAASAQCDSGFYCNTFNYTGQITPHGDGAGQGVYQFGGGNAILNVATNLSDGASSSRSLTQGANGIGGYTTLSGANTYTGGTTVTSGILQFASESAIPQLGTPSVTIAPYAIVAAGYALDQATLNTITPGSQGVVALAFTDTSSTASSTVLDFNTPGLAGVSLGAVGQQTYYGTILPYVAPGGALGTFMLGGGPAPNNYYSALTLTAPLTDVNATGAGSTNQLIVNAAAITNPITVYLDNNETYSGSTQVQGGTLSLGDGTLNGNLINTSSVQLQNYSTLAFQEGAGAVTFTRVITGDGYVQQSGPGTVTLTQVETYAATSINFGYASGGGTFIDGGTLALGPSASIASSAYVALQNYNNSTTPPTFDISNGGAQTIQYLFGTENTAVVLGANTLTIGSASGTWLNPAYYTNNPVNSNNVQPDFLGSISGTGGVVFQLPQHPGDAPYVFGGTNSYSGPTTVASGTVQAAGVDGLSPNSAVTVLSGATLDVAGYSQVIGSLAGAGTVTSSVATPATLTLGGDNSSTVFSGLVTDAGGGGLTLDKVGTGTFTLTGANAYTGGTLLDAGELVVGNAQALGTGALTIAPGATLGFGGSLSLANGVVLNGAGAQSIDSGAQTVALTGAISGTGTLTKLGAGELILTGANTYSGGTTLSAGTLGLGAGGVLGTGTLTMSAGTGLQFLAANIALTNNVALAGAGLYQFDTNGQTATASGVISGSGTLQKVGAGALNLTGANTFSGGVNVVAGTLGVGGASALATGAVTLSGGATLQALVDNLTIGNALTLASGAATFDTMANSVTLSGGISGSGALNKIGGGTLTLAGANSSTGGVNLLAGTLDVSSAGVLGSGPLGLNGGATFQILGAGLNISNAVTLLGGGAIVDTGTNTTTFSGSIAGTGGLYKIGSGALNLTAANSFAGGVTVAAGTLGVGANSALGSGALMLGSGTSLQFTAANLTLPNAIALAGTGAATFDTGAQTETVSGVISGSAALTKIGAGALVLSGANTFSGGVGVTAGTLAVGNSAALGAGALSLAGGSTLQFATTNLNLANPVSLAAGGENFDTGANVATLVGTISGAGALSKLGTGALVLASANTYSGGTTLSAGTLGVGASGSLGAGALTVSPGAGLQFTAAGVSLPNAIALAGAGLHAFDTGALSAQLSGVISGPGALQKTGSGLLVLSGANTFSGGVDVVAGALGVTNASALGAGSLNLSDGTTLAIFANGLNIANPVALLGPDPTFDTGSNTVTMSGVVSGAGALTKLGAGTLVLTGTNTYTGATAVNAGVLEVDGSIASSPLTTIATGATLSGVGAGGGVAVGAGGVLAPGNAASPYGALTARGGVTFAGGSTFGVNLSPSAVSLLSVTQGATLSGVVAVSAANAAYNPAVKYNILTAAAGVTGTFNSVTVSGAPGYFGLLSYDPNNVYLQVEQGDPTSSVHDLAISRQSQMVTTRILGSLLLGANEQINCTSCVSGFASVGSLSVGAHGRWPLDQRLTLLAGLSFDEFSAEGAHVTSAPILAASLRYDLVDWGRSRPFFEAGAEVAPYEVSNYTRNYAFGTMTGAGRGVAISNGVSAFARAGWVWRASREDEVAVYGDLVGNWQHTGGYSETPGPQNPQPATFASGVDRFGIARFGGQYTRLFNPHLEGNVNLGVARSFGAGVGVDASVPGFGVVPNLAIGSSTWAEFGARLGYRVGNGFVIDAFVLGTAGQRPAGETLHGGLALRYAF